METFGLTLVTLPSLTELAREREPDRAGGDATGGFDEDLAPEGFRCAAGMELKIDGLEAEPEDVSLNISL